MDTMQKKTFECIKSLVDHFNSQQPRGAKTLKLVEVLGLIDVVQDPTSPIPRYSQRMVIRE